MIFCRTYKGMVAFSLFCGLVPSVFAIDAATLLTPMQAGVPLAHPIAQNELSPPPFSLIASRPKDPAYVAGLPGLPQGRVVVDDYGVKRPKFDGVFIRQSRVEKGQVVIPPGGLVYLEDTWGGEVSLHGEPIPVLTRMPTYIDYNMSIVVKENVTIPAGQSVVVGGQVYHYYATVGHEQTMNHSLHVKTIAGTDWDWAFGNPVLSSTQPGWWGMKFTQLYNQGQAKEVSKEKLVFDWISGVRMDRLLLADQKVFAGLAKVGQEWTIGNRVLRLTDINEKATTARIQVLENGEVKMDRILGPINKDRLLEDSVARKSLIFEYKDVAGFIVPGANAFKDGQVDLKIYGKAFSLNYGETYAGDPRFSVYPVGCPTGHNFGFMLVNKEEIRIDQGGMVEGPEKYFKVSVEKIDGNEVLSWHIADRDGNRSYDLGGKGVMNVDLVLGQGRVAGQAILKDVGRTMQVRMATALTQAQNGHSSGPFSSTVWIGIIVLGLGLAGLGYEFGRRRLS